MGNHNTIQSIQTKIRNKYLNITTHQLNQYPYHLKNVATCTLEVHGLEQNRATELAVKRDEITVGSQNYYNLFRKQSEAKKVVIVIEGEPGIGKTILCASIVDDWASGEHFQDFFITLWLPLDQINLTSVSSVSDVLNVLYGFKHDTCSCIVKYLRNHPSNILIVADGWDRCSEARYQQDSFFNSIFFGNPFPSNSSVTIVISSRPGCHLPRFDRFISIKGFSKEIVHNCIISEFSNDPEKIKYFLEQLENNVLVEKMSTVPLNLALFLNIFQSCESFPVTMTELYTKVIWGLAQVSIRSSGKYKHIKNLSCYDDLPQELQQSWWSLCELAFKNIERYHTAFSRSEASKFLSSQLSAVSYFGTIKFNSICEKVYFYFLHPVIEEYLCAQHLVRQPLTTQLLDESVRMNSLSTYFWKFFLSIYVNDTLSPDFNVISHSIKLLLKWHHSSDSECLFFCHCSFEAKNKIINHEIITALRIVNRPGLSLCFGHPQDAYDILAVVYVIKSMEHECCSIEINFQNCNLTETQILELGRAVGSKEDKIQMKALDLSENRLSESVVVDFIDHAAAALQSLEKLFLRNCGIRESGINAFLDSLMKSSPTLMQLDLSFNPLSASILQILQDHITFGTLMKLEVLSLKSSLPKDVNTYNLGGFTEALATSCLSFRRLDLSTNYLGNPDNPDLQKIISRFIDHRQNFDLCLNAEYMSEVDNKFVSVMEESIRTKGTIDHTIAHGVIVGPGRSGKNTLMNRLMGEGPPDPDYICPSTGVLESVVKVEVKKLCTIAAAASKLNLKWQRLEYDEEALELMMTTSKYHAVSPSIPKPVPIKYIAQDQSSVIDSPSLSPTTDGSSKPIVNECVSPESQSNNDGSESGNRETLNTTRDVAVYASDIAPVEIFKKALKCRRMDALREHLESSWSLYLTNTGGQIEFQELLPILICGPSVFFITFPLHHDLHKPYIVQYQPSSGQVKKYRSTTTLMEELIQILATICALDSTNSQHNVEYVPKVFFIGTHRDLLPECTIEQDIERMDKQLQARIRSTVLFSQSSIQFAKPPNQMMFTVNNLSKHDHDFQKIRSAVQQTVEFRKHSEQFTITCPSSWLVFSLILRAKHKSIQALKFDDCFEIAHECGISDRKELSEALSFIHSRLGLVRYFNVPELNQYVIVDPQILFDKITHLIVETFTSDHAEVTEIENFYQRGIFPLEVVQRISKKCGSDLQLPSMWLTKLLNHLRIAALFTDRDKQNKYFFPAALCHAPEMHPQHTPSSRTLPSPFLVAFKSGFCPRGIPGALIKYLMTNEMQSRNQWELLPKRIFRNQVSFRISGYGTVTLKMLPTHLEIRIDSEEDADLMITCKEAYVQIKKGVKVVSNQYFNCSPFFGFYCSLAGCASQPHPARVIWRGENSRMMCTLDQLKQGGLPTGRGYEFWNIKKESNSTNVDTRNVIDSGSSGVLKHLGQIADSMAEWEGKIAEELGLSEADVAGIKLQYPSKLNMQSREALKLWKQKLGPSATYQALIRAFECAGYRQYANQVREVIHPQGSDIDDSSCEEDSFPLPQPHTYPNFESLSPIECPSPKPSLPCESYSLIHPESLPKGCIPSWEDLSSCKVTFVPKLSSNIKPSKPSEFLEPPAAKVEEESVLKDVSAEEIDKTELCANGANHIERISSDIDDYSEEHVLLDRSSGKLGLNIAGGAEHYNPVFDQGRRGIYISKVTKGGAAEATGRLRLGDRILEINHHSVRFVYLQHAVQLLSSQLGNIELLIQHIPQPPGLQTVVLEKEPDAKLGICIRGGNKRSNGNPLDKKDKGIFISQIAIGGLAHKDGRQMIGHRIMEVNGISLLDSSHQDAVKALKSSPDRISITVCQGYNPVEELMLKYEVDHSIQAERSRSDSQFAPGVHWLTEHVDSFTPPPESQSTIASPAAVTTTSYNYNTEAKAEGSGRKVAQEHISFGDIFSRVHRRNLYEIPSDTPLQAESPIFVRRKTKKVAEEVDKEMRLSSSDQRWLEEELEDISSILETLNSEVSMMQDEISQREKYII